jgi:serine/threonine protein kinase
VASAASHPIGSVVAGRYRLERELGAGGMGEVFVAVQEPLGRKVALKLMRAGLVGPAAARFEREAKSLAATVHPNIVTIFDFGRTDDGELFMAMELVPGLTLRQHLARQGRLTPDQALPIVVEICRALDATHRAGIVHRDLKPENVMLVDDVANRTVTAKVLDFGIARLHDQSSSADDAPKLTQTGHLVGTPGYMAPETVLEAVFDDPRSDLYAVGVILWELLTNSSLFSAPTPIALVMKHALDAPPTLSTTLQRQVHPDLEALLTRLLHKDRHQRFASAAAVIDAVAHLPDDARAPIASRARIVDIDPSAPTVAGTQAVPTPVALSSSSPSASSSSMQPAVFVTAPTDVGLPAPSSMPTAIVERPSSPAMAAAFGAVVVLLVIVIALLWFVLQRPVPAAAPASPALVAPVPVVPVVPVPAAPVVPAPAAPVAPAVEAPAVPADVVDKPVGSAKPVRPSSAPKPTPTKAPPTSTPYEPDLN